MERLTEKSLDMVWMKSQERPNLILEPCEVSSHDVKLLLNRLAEYEDTGLTPEEMSAVKLFAASADNDKSRRLLELSKAEAEGRVVVLPEPCNDIDWIHFVQLAYLDSKGRIIELPDAPNEDRKSIHDALCDYMAEWIHDPSVGLFGPDEGEAHIMQALIDGLLLKEEKNAD